MWLSLELTSVALSDLPVGSFIDNQDTISSVVRNKPSMWSSLIGSALNSLVRAYPITYM